MYSCHDDEDEEFLGEAAGYVPMIQDLCLLCVLGVHHLCPYKLTLEYLKPEDTAVLGHSN